VAKPQAERSFAAPHRLGDVLTLKEYLGHAWSNEVIHYDYVFAPGECRSTDVRLLDSDGKEIPAQLSAVTRYADGSLQSAQVWLLVTLGPNEVKQFSLHSGPSRASTNLEVTRSGDVLEVNNGLVGARFQLGEQQFKSPIPASQVPAYLQAVQLRGGERTGRVD
jgi:hypothetical protein